VEGTCGQEETVARKMRTGNQKPGVAVMGRFPIEMPRGTETLPTQAYLRLINGSIS